MPTTRPTRNPKQRPLPQTTRQETSARPHPSRGGSRGYDLTTRQMAVTVKTNGADDDDIFNDLRQQQLHPSKRTTSRWARRLAQEGRINPYEMNGNRSATALKGDQLLSLSVFCLCYPKAMAAEVNACLFHSTIPGNQP